MPYSTWHLWGSPNEQQQKEGATTSTDSTTTMSNTGPGRHGRFMAKFKNAVSRDSGSDSAEGTTTESATEPVSERRREQIRRAQRLHRQRKAEHSQRLTAEITDLRAKDAAKTARIDHLESTITFLSNLLNQHGIIHEIPKAQSTSPQAQIAVLETSLNNVHAQQLSVRLPRSTHSHPPPASLSRSPSYSGTGADLTSAQLGITFVLNLEQPCLYHHHGPASDDDDLLGHTSLMQAPIMARAPSLITSPSRPQPHLPPGATWSVPGEELERLLSFSNQLQLPVEITPVQAWSQIRERAGQGWNPSENDLDGLLRLMKGLVTCYGFGAVMEKTAFEHLLEQHCRFG